jgi:hypothetical protein
MGLTDDDLREWLLGKSRLAEFQAAIEAADRRTAVNLLSGFANDKTGQTAVSLVDLYLERPSLLNRLRSRP